MPNGPSLYCVDPTQHNLVKCILNRVTDLGLGLERSIEVGLGTIKLWLESDVVNRGCESDSASIVKTQMG